MDFFKNITERNASIALAGRISSLVNTDFENGSLFGKVTPVTAELLKFWFSEEFCSTRTKNFHDGQRQAILNVIYLHEVLAVENVLSMYRLAAEELISSINLENLAKEKYQYPKYAVKMATGTGKTWVMHAILIWQILNAKYENEYSGRYTKNFLIVAPGLIVYERLLDAFYGRIRRGEETRDFSSCDFLLNRELFIPPAYQEEIFSFVQNCTVSKEDGIGKKTTGDGIIAITNWHLFENQIDDRDFEESDKSLVNTILKIRPGKSAGNDLSVLDGRFLRGSELSYLADLPNLMVINDEAHHIHEVKKGNEVEEVEWQKSLDEIAKKKGSHYFQIDFSATPFATVGSGKNTGKYFFPHIVVDFDLATAMRKGLVKTLLIDKRQELTELERLDYKAERDENNKVIGLSNGQRLMLRAGLTKLAKLENDFLKIDDKKNPKMLIVCEDTKVSPFVESFLKEEGIAEEDIVKIDSNSKGEVSEQDWTDIKKNLFDIDKFKSPKIIVSVLMLREGFDVNNICVIVPLRASNAPILLEQTIGRGLRLMWREPEYQDTRREDREKVLIKRAAPNSYLDMLSIIEHPAFIGFYNELLEEGLAGIEEGEGLSGNSAGDLLNVGLKENYEDYDLFWPNILKDSDEEIEDSNIDLKDLSPFTLYSLDKLRLFFAKDGETFISQELTTKTQFGKYVVTANLFTSQSYNEYLQKIILIIMNRYLRVSAHKDSRLPGLQINQAETASIIDAFIRTRLFGTDFDPMNGNDWKILLAKNGLVTEHVIKEVAKAINNISLRITSTEAEVDYIKFSSVKTIRMREAYSHELVKTIYQRTSFPSHGGRLEKSFEEYLDRDGEVLSFIKIDESQHYFARIFYIRKDGHLASYHPDFIVCTKDYMYMIETKGDNMVDDQNVQQKRVATIDYVRKINLLPEENRLYKDWKYVLLQEKTFYALYENGATITDICNIGELSKPEAEGTLF